MSATSSTKPEFAVIMAAAGVSSRFGNSGNKLLARLASETVLGLSLRAFLQREDVAEIIVATRNEADLRTEPALADARVRTCAGGASRAESVRLALGNVSKPIEWIAVHDAARPLVSQELIDRTLAAALEHGAAAPATAVTLTIKQAKGSLPAKVERTVPRSELWALQTPQIMKRSELEEAFARCDVDLAQVTDDLNLLERTGKPVWLVQGEERNLKITTAMDLRVAEMYLQQGEPGRPRPGPGPTRPGSAGRSRPDLAG